MTSTPKNIKVRSSERVSCLDQKQQQKQPPSPSGLSSIPNTLFHLCKQRGNYYGVSKGFDLSFSSFSERLGVLGLRLEWEIIPDPKRMKKGTRLSIKPTSPFFGPMVGDPVITPRRDFIPVSVDGPEEGDSDEWTVPSL